MHFARPDNLYWLLVLIPMAGVALWYGWWQRRVRDKIGDAGLVEQMADSRSTTLRLTRIGLVLAGTALLCLAAAQPQWGRVHTQVEQKGIDVVFALDLSKSMLAQDVPPTRLQAATDEIETVLDRLSGDRVGMVVFTTVSFVQSPLTTDYGALRFYLDKLDPQQMSIGGTAIGDALRDSVELLTGEPLGDSEETSAIKNAKMDRAENQIVVLVSDGEDHQSNPVAAAGTARQRGVHVLTVGIGTSDGAKIPVYGPNGQLRGYKRNNRGDPVRTSLRESQLRQIADAGGGIYMPYQGDGSVAQRVLTFVDQLKQSTFQGQMAAQYHDRYLWFLLPGLLMLLASFLLGERRRGRFGWSRPAAETTLVLAIALGAFGSTSCKRAFQSQPQTVEQGNTAIREGNFKAALEAFDRAESELTNPPPTLFYNRGLAELGNQTPEKARASFARALESPDAGVRFDAHLNVGLSFARHQQWKSALDEFRSAFRLAQEHPTAIDASALEMLRHNTELAYYKLYPPCRTREDDHEDNDNPSAPTTLKKPSARNLTLCGLDDDWYVVDALPGATVEIKATFTKLGKHRDPTHTFLPNRDDLNVELYGADGETRLAADSGQTDTTSPPPQTGPVTRTISSFEVGPKTPLGDKSRLLLRVAAADKLEFAYDLTIDVQPPCRALEDDAEENDVRAAATKVEDGAHQMQLCPGDPDWFRIDAQMGDSVFVDVRPLKPKRKEGRQTQGSKLDLAKTDLQMIDAETGESVGDARRQGPYQTIGLQTVESDRTLKVGLSTDSEHGGAYRLRVYVYPPCIVGDDRHEENDTLQARARLPKKKNHHRYLRICPNDPDFFAARPKAPRHKGKAGQKDKKRKGHNKKSLEIGLQKVPRRDSKDGQTDKLEIDALEQRSGKVIASGKTPKAPSSHTTAGTPPNPATRGTPQHQSGARFDKLLKIPETDKDEIPVRITGEPTFYHLVELPDSQSKSQNRRNKKQNNNQKNEKSQKNKKDSNKDKKRNRKQRQNSKKRQDKRKNADKKKKTASEKRMEDILEALEDSDKNFQLRNALEKEKRQRHIEKDW